jgi:hypothetical protein
MIKVDERTHAQLAEIAAESGLTIGAYLARLAGTGQTSVDWPAIAAHTEDYLREAFGFTATREELAEFEARHAAIEAGRDARRTSA